MSRRDRLVSCAAAAMVALLALANRSAAQGLSGLGRWEETLEFAVDADREQIADPFRRVDFARTRTDQKVGVRGRLPIFDPRFVTTSANFNFGLFRDRLVFDGVKTPIGGRLVGYDLNAGILPEKAVTATIFANQTEGTISREFAGTSDVLAANQGVSVSIRRLRLPSTISFRKERLEEESRYSDQTGRRSELRNIFSYDGRRSSKTQDLTVRFEDMSVDDRVFSTLTHRARTAGVYHRLDLGEAQRASVTSSVMYFNRKGAFSSSSFSADEGLLIQHNRSLSTTYHYSFFDYALLGAQSRSHVGVASLQHRVYDSLRTDAMLRLSNSSSQSGGERRLTARADPNYRKRLAGGGTLIAGLSGSFELQNNRFDTRDFLVVQERHAPQFGVPFRLDRPRAMVETIFVADESGTVVFQEGVDYFVRTFGDFAEITVIPTGRIREGQALSVAYRVNVPSDIEFSTQAVHLNLGTDYGWIYPYIGYERTRQNLLAGVDDLFLDDLTARSAGVQLRREGQKVRGSLLNEYRTQDSRRLAFDSLQLGQVIAVTPDPTLMLSLSLTEDFSNYRIPQRRTRSGLGRGTIGWRSPVPGLFFEAFNSLRLWRDSVAPDETFSDNGLRITWSAGKLEVRSLIGYDLRQRDGSRTRAWHSSVRVVRRIGAT